MRLTKIVVENFRLLQQVNLSLESKTTVIVGRNNSGKTSLTELFRRLLSDSPRFYLEDFSLTVHEKFWNAFLLFQGEAEEEAIRKELPLIEAKFFISYDENAEDLGVLSEFIVDLNPASLEAMAVVQYKLKDGEINSLFLDISHTPGSSNAHQQKLEFFKLIRERLPGLYTTSLVARDPSDETNQKKMELSRLRNLIQAGFINAQRGLDDATHKEKDILGKILERLLSTAASENAEVSDRNTAKELDGVVKDIQQKIDTDFKNHLVKLLPALQLFGYPGLNDPQLHTETTLDVQRLLENHTKLRYAGANGIGLPETYNGLGSRNLILILLQLFEFFKTFQAKQTAPAASIIFIEEPEAHLHPQMQEVFIRKLDEIATAFVTKLNGGNSWPVQFIVTTHSTHIANEAPFESIRYFLCNKKSDKHTCVKDLRVAFSKPPLSFDKDFLHKFLTLTHCDLFFADKAILIEGPTERLLMPKMIEKVSEEEPLLNFNSQYISTVEVGGAHAHHFFEYLDFLELTTLIITDLDTVKAVESVERTSYKKCMVAEGTRVSNTAIKKWFSDEDISPATLVGKTEQQKIVKFRRLGYQVPEEDGRACGRSFEDAFILANATIFDVDGITDNEKAQSAWEKSAKLKKTDFALEYGIHKTDWVVPKYIKDGLKWLATSSGALSELAPTTEVAPTPGDNLGV